MITNNLLHDPLLRSPGPWGCVAFEVFTATIGEGPAMPLLMGYVPAGFPSPAADYIDKKLDLNEYLIQHPAATFFIKVSGDSMIGAGINNGDILIVDRAVEAVDNKVVVAVVDGDFTVKRLRKYGGKVLLVPENEKFPTIEITPDTQFEVWGVVTNVIHPLN